MNYEIVGIACAIVFVIASLTMIVRGIQIMTSKHASKQYNPEVLRDYTAVNHYGEN